MPPLDPTLEIFLRNLLIHSFSQMTQWEDPLQKEMDSLYVVIKTEVSYTQSFIKKYSNLNRERDYDRLVLLSNTLDMILTEKDCLHRLCIFSRD
jgi:hypothetical protein